MTTPVDRLYGEFIALKKHLDAKGEVSLSSSADENYRKALILSAASYFETRVCDDINQYVEDVCVVGTFVPDLVKNKAVNNRLLYCPRVLGQWFDGIRFYAAASSPTRSRRTWAGLR